MGTYVISAELWAIFHGLKLSLDKGWKHITVESDSAEAMKLISNSDSHPKDALRLGKYLVILEEPSALLFLLLLV
ncbi:hypothetical protein HKD37_19G052706 [Glycine soja]